MTTISNRSSKGCALYSIGDCIQIQQGPLYPSFCWSCRGRCGCGELLVRGEVLLLSNALALGRRDVVHRRRGARASCSMADGSAGPGRMEARCVAGLHGASSAGGRRPCARRPAGKRRRWDGLRLRAAVDHSMNFTTIANGLFGWGGKPVNSPSPAEPMAGLLELEMVGGRLEQLALAGTRLTSQQPITSRTGCKLISNRLKFYLKFQLQSKSCNSI